MRPSVGWSRFASERYRPGLGRSYFRGDDLELVDLIAAHWGERRPGAGRPDLSRVIVVPLPPEKFVSAVISVTGETPLHARFAGRREGETGFIEVRADAAPEPAGHASAVLYSAATLLENGGERSGDCDWEIVAIQASPVADEPMNPVTMARNFLAEPGGTPCDYSAREFAEAILYWSRHCNALPESELEF